MHLGQREANEAKLNEIMSISFSSQQYPIHIYVQAHQDGRVVKALDLSSNGRMSAWVRTPLLVTPVLDKNSKTIFFDERLIFVIYMKVITFYDIVFLFPLTPSPKEGFF